MSAPGSASSGAGWHADPSGRHELRYWDGTSWTASVSDRGVQSDDPLGAAPPPSFPPYPTTAYPTAAYGATSAAYPGALPVSSAGRRLGAALLDGLLALVTLFIGWLIWSFVIWGRGQTPAKQLLHMRCIDVTTNQAAGFGKMALRELVGKSLLGSFTGGITTLVGGIMVLSDQQRQALWDKLASTVVIDDPTDAFAPQ